jgi:hypothetical protein
LKQENEEEASSARESFKFYFFRTSLVLAITFGSFVFPDLNLVLTAGGALLGTIMTIIVPTLY